MNELQGHLLLVDDEESLIRAFEKLSRLQRYRFSLARSGVEALEKLGTHEIDVALLDLNVSGHSGLDLLDYIKANRLMTEAIIITGRGTVETAVASLKRGAYDYLLKPFEDIDRVSVIINKAMEKVALVRRLRQLENNELLEPGLLIGRGPKMREVHQFIESVAPSQSSVLVLGESGTGKELAARTIHEKSLRAKQPFVVVNCSALPETLLESELFGHMKGSFTGAVNDKKGLFEEADGGTIFLDEIGEIPPSVQVKLLRILQDGELRRVGGNNATHVDVRVLSATNKDLYQMVRKNHFREDLFYRLNVITIHLPPLREKKEDIPMLAYHFIQKYAKKTGKRVERVSLDALQSLQEYGWPGNVRELENVIERAVVLAASDSVTSRELPSRILGEVFYKAEEGREQDLTRLPYQKAKERAIYLFNRSYLCHLLRTADGNISVASAHAGMDRSNLKKIIKKCEINVHEFKKGRGSIV